MSGEIPHELGNLYKLETLILMDNQLSGMIPSDLSNLRKLKIVWISGNQFTGCIPKGLRERDITDALYDLGMPFCFR